MGGLNPTATVESPRTSKVRFKVQNLSREVSVESKSESEEASGAESSKSESKRSENNISSAGSEKSSKNNVEMKKVLDIKP